MNIERAIREYLSSHGIKQTFIAERCGWTRQKTNTIVTGRKKITAEECGAISEAVGVPYDYFYNAATTAKDSA